MRLYPNVIINILRLLSALPFAVYYSSLQLYLLSTHYNKNVAASLVGSILALSFGLSLIGGYLADRYISFRAFFIFSLICQAIGCLTFYTSIHNEILWFSCLFLSGSMGITVSLNMMITQRYEAYDYTREKAFFWLYMSLNLGYLLGYSIAGYYGNLDEYYKIPIFIFISSTIAIILCILNWQQIDKPSIMNHRRNYYYFVCIILIVLIGIRFLLQFSQASNAIIIVAWVLISLSMFFKLRKMAREQQSEINIFYILLFAGLLFWAIYFLAPMALIVFIKYHVNLKIFNFSIAPQWIQNINTFIIILGISLIGSRQKTNLFNIQSIVKQFTFGLLCMGIGFGLLAAGIYLTPNGSKVALTWIVLNYALQSMGELFIGPIGFALAGRLIPKPYQSIMTGIWITLLGVASAISSNLSVLAPSSIQHLPAVLTHYEYFFLWIGLIATINASLIYIVSKNQLARKTLT